MANNVTNNVTGTKPTKVTLKDKKRILIELIATDPGLTNRYLSKKLKVNHLTVAKWRGTPQVIDAIFNRYMELAGSHLPDIIAAQIEEAKRGNTRAAELILKQLGKLQDTLIVKVEAPFMQHLKYNNIEEAEVIDKDDAIEIGNNVFIDQEITLPPRDKKNDTPYKKYNKQKKALKKTYSKKRATSSAKERKRLRKRAMAVGLELLPPRKPKKEVIAAWLMELERLEKESNNKYDN